MKNIKITGAIVLASLVILQSCKKDSPPNHPVVTVPTTPGTGIGTGPGGSIVAGTDPALASTQGFFLDSWSAATFTLPGTTQSATKPSADGAVSVTVDLSQITTKTSNKIFGNNTNPYMGQYVTEPVLMANITSLSPKILRAPGGSLSDIYFWNGDGNRCFILR